MKILLGAIFVMTWTLAQCQNACICNDSDSNDKYCTLDFPLGEHMVSLKATPNFTKQLSHWFQVALRGEKYKAIVRIAVLDSVPFVYDVQCHGCENSVYEWRLRSVFHNTAFEISDDRGNLPNGLFQSSLIFTVTPRE